jgi:hypothetical protein
LAFVLAGLCLFAGAVQRALTFSLT